MSVVYYNLNIFTDNSILTFYSLDMSGNLDIFVILIINSPFPHIFHRISTGNLPVFHR